MKRITTKTTALRKKIQKKKVSKTQAINYNFKKCINKVSKLIFPNMQISSSASQMMNKLLSEIFEILTTKAIEIMKSSRKKILTEREFKRASTSLIPGDLQRYAIQQGLDAIQKELNYLKQEKNKNNNKKK